MTENGDLLSQLEEMLGWKKSKAFYASKLGISEELVDELLKELKNQSENSEKSIKGNNEKGTLESTIEVSFEPKNDIELAALHKIDLNKYKITSYWSKQKSNGKFTSSVLATLKKAQDYTLQDFVKFLEKYKSPPRITFKPVHKGLQKVDVELNMADFHLAKKTTQGETVGEKEFQYYEVANQLIENVSKICDIRKIVFPISNDFFHTDTYQNTTTNGTPQDVTVWYDEEYEKGFDILANTIYYLLSKCEELEVILVQGNHDRTKGFYVAHALDVYFKDYENLTFQRHHSVTKHTVLGNTFIGYHHGNSCKLDDLPLIFATSEDSSKEFGNAKFREVHTGDKHHYMAKEVKGVRIQQMPSLSGHDRWHIDNNYVNQIRAGLAIVYHPEKGKIMEFEERI